MSKSNILFVLTGSIACYKSAAIISKLVQDGHEVQTACSSSAFEFIGEGTLEGLTGRPVFRNIYAKGQMMGHIDLPRWADVAVVCPATARSINGLAAGTAEDPLGSLFLAYDFKKPFIVVPAMNQFMLKNPATQRSLATLESWGVMVLPTDEGHQACGDVGPGRLLAEEEILKRLREVLKT